ncbi:MAG: hypothetical protein ABI603_08860 [Acidobacteriota bacterium]
MDRITACAALLLTICPGGTVSAQGTQPGATETLRHLYISASGKGGAPVADLTAADLVVKEDGRRLEVVGLERATAPLRVALLVDDSGPGLRFIREGAGLFIQRLGGLGEIALFSIGGRNTAIVDFTGDVAALYQGVRQLTTRTTTGAYLLDGVHDAIEALGSRDAERPVLVVLMLEGPEFSSVRADRLLDELRRSRAVLHVVSLGKPTLKTMTAWSQMPTDSLRENLDENINRKKFVEDGTRMSGGRFAQVLVDSGIPGAMQAVAEDLAAQYVVVFRRPGGSPAKKITVTASRGDVRVRVRAEAAR